MQAVLAIIGHTYFDSIRSNGTKLNMYEILTITDRTDQVLSLENIDENYH